MPISSLVPGIFVLMIAIYFAAAAGAEPSTVVVSQTGTRLVDALLNQSVNHVIISSNYSVGTEFDGYVFPHKPLSINRNVTIGGSNGTSTVLDFDFLKPSVQLCGTCVLTIANITLYRERRGSGGDLDWLIGQPGSKLVIFNSFKLRLACSSPADATPVLQHLPRSKLGPGPGSKQQFAVGDVVFEGVRYSNQLQLIDYSVDVPWAVLEGRGPTGGYAQVENNVTRVCLNMVDPHCYASKGSEACVNELVDQLLSGNTASGSKPDASVAGIAAGVAVAGAVVLGAVVLGFVWVHKRKRQHQLLPLPQPKHSISPRPTSASSAGGCSGRNGSELDVEPGLESFMTVAQSHRAPLATGKGWQLHSMLTTPLLSTLDQDRIEFGELLGAGSFGRVYRGTWGGREVAIKVIDHDTDALEAVENEVQLMFRFNHPNIVRAQHSVTYIQVPGRGIGSRAKGTLRIPPISRGGNLSGSAESGSGQRAAQCSSNSNGGTSGTAGSLAALQQQHSPQEQQQVQQQLQCLSDSSMGTCGAGKTEIGGPGRTKDVAGSPGSVRAETWLVTEFCDLGTLGNVAAHLGIEQPEERTLQLLLLLRDAAQGLQVLHSEKVVHGDLNARNVLVSSSAVAPFGTTAKISDFGLSRTIKQHKSHRTTNTIGSLSHMPPELLYHGHMSTAADIYSFAVMAWELHTGDYAFHKVLYGQLFEAVVLRQQRPDIPADMPADLVFLLQHCWAQEAAQRPMIATLLQALRVMIQHRQDVSSRAVSAVESSSGSSVNLSEVVGDLAALLGPIPERSSTGQEVLPQQQQQKGLDMSQVQPPVELPGAQGTGVAHHIDSFPAACGHDLQARSSDSKPSQVASCLEPVHSSRPQKHGFVACNTANTGATAAAQNAGNTVHSSVAAAESGIPLKLPRLDTPSTPNGAVQARSSFRCNSVLSLPADHEEDLQLDPSVREGQQYWFV